MEIFKIPQEVLANPDHFSRDIYDFYDDIYSGECSRTIRLHPFLEVLSILVISVSYNLTKI